MSLSSHALALFIVNRKDSRMKQTLLLLTISLFFPTLADAQWKTRIQRDNMTDEVSLSGAEVARGGSGFVYLCDPDDKSEWFMLVTGNQLTGRRKYVRIRVDDLETHRAQVIHDSNNGLLFELDRQVLREVASGESVRVEADIWKEGSTVFRFPLEGSKPVINEAREVCRLRALR